MTLEAFTQQKDKSLERYKELYLAAEIARLLCEEALVEYKRDFDRYREQLYAEPMREL